MTGTDLLELSEEVFLQIWSELPQGDKDSLGEVDRARCIERFRKATSYIDSSVGRLSRAHARDQPKEPAPVCVELVSGADIRPEPIDWIWPGWLAARKLHIIAGAPEAGKTTIALAMAATLTIGGRWPDGAPSTPATVVIWSGEDDVQDTLVPRLIALGADLKRVQFVRRTLKADGGCPFDPANDMPALQEALQVCGARLLILDPIVSAVAGDSHENAKVRRSLQPVVDLAEAANCAVLGISHFSKGTAGRDPVERVTGSIAFGALPRLIFAAAKLPEEEGGGRIFVRSKSNIGISGGGFGYRLESVELPGGIVTSRLLWGEALTGAARTLLADTETVEGSGAGAIADAMDFLRECLANCPVSAKQIEKDAEGAGHAWRTVQEAARRLKVERRKIGMQGGWVWCMSDVQPLPKAQAAPKVHEGADQKVVILRVPSGNHASSVGADSEEF